MFKKIVGLLPLVLSSLPYRVAKKAVDAALDVIEDEVAKSPSKIDDIIVLPLVSILRATANIPDDFDGDED